MEKFWYGVWCVFCIFMCGVLALMPPHEGFLMRCLDVGFTVFALVWAHRLWRVIHGR